MTISRDAGKLAGAVVLAAGLSAGHAATAATTTPGTYSITSYYVSATPTGSVTCPFPAGTYLLGKYVYPGAVKPGATSRVAVNGNGYNNVLRLQFPTTPAATATSWSGNVTETFLPGGTPFTVAFTSTFTINDNRSYVAKTTYVYAPAGGTCTSVVQETGILD